MKTLFGVLTSVVIFTGLQSCNETSRSEPPGKKELPEKPELPAPPPM